MLRPKCSGSIDPEHFGLSIPYAREAPSADVIAAMGARRVDGRVDQILAIGPDALRELILAHVDQGLSKFVVRPLSADTAGWRDDLEHLAETVLDLQT